MRWPFSFRRGPSPAPPGPPAVTDPPHSDHTSAAPVVPPSQVPTPAGDSTSAVDGKRTAGLPHYLELFGEKSVPLVLIAVGIGMVAADDSIEVNQVTGWGEPEYVGMLAFAALLVLLGCLERIVELRSARRPVVQRPQRIGNADRQVSEVPPSQSVPPGEIISSPVPPGEIVAARSIRA